MVALYLSIKFDEKDNRVPFIEDMLKTLNSSCPKEKFMSFEKDIFFTILKGNVFIKTPFDILGEIFSYLKI